MRINAYVLAADPAWLEESVRSYYDLVDKIIVSYDESSTSWTGTPIRVDESLSRLKSVDPEGKMVLRPGSYFRPGHHAMENDTHQRQQALGAASEDADWVIQLDTDEVCLDPIEFAASIRAAEERGCAGLEYPLRILYQHLGGDRYLEYSTRLWGVTATYPGPTAVRAGTVLTFGRQCADELYRVDFKDHNTDLAHPHDAPVDRVVRPDQAVMHYSWIRSEEHMESKARWSGHANDFDWTPWLTQWRAIGKHPRRATLRTPWQRGPMRKLVRIVRVPQAPDALALARNGLGR